MTRVQALINQFNRQLNQANQTIENLRGQVSQLTTQHAQLVNAVGYSRANNQMQRMALMASINNRPPIFTPRSRSNFDQHMSPLVSAPMATRSFGRINFGAAQWEQDDLIGQPPIFDEDYD